MGADLIRDSPLGQILNRLFGVLPYADQRADYQIPEHYLLQSDATTGEKSAATQKPGAPTEEKRESEPPRIQEPVTKQISTLSRRSSTTDFRARRMPSANPNLSRTCTGIEGEDGAREGERDVEAAAPPGADSVALEEKYVLVDWVENDPDRPVNWSLTKRSWIVGLIMLYTFSIYVGSAIYTPGIPGIMEEFNVGLIHATWGLTLYVLGYGMGPMLLSPIQDMALYGRNGVYVWGLLLFVIFQLPIIWSDNMAAILAFRFFTGFIGSPALATGGASLGDVFAPQYLPYLIGFWSIGAVCGPVLGPVMGSFAVQAKGWRWCIYELIWICAFTFLLLIWTLPETLESKILTDRARRLRKLTKNPNLRSQGEIEMEKEPPVQFFKHALVHPFRLSLEPAVLFANLYMGLAYSILYLWFEAFPIVFTEIYGWNLGVSTLPYLGFIVAAMITYPLYALYQKYHIEPRWVRNNELAPEVRLEIGVFGGMLIPVSLLIFGWSAGRGHWFGPVFGASLYLPGVYLLFQSVLIYLSTCYPHDAASILASNDLFRSSVAAFFPLFGRAFFKSKLGLGGGCTLLAGISIFMVFVMAYLIRIGPELRKRSKWAVG